MTQDQIFQLKQFAITEAHKIVFDSAIGLAYGKDIYNWLISDTKEAKEALAASFESAVKLVE